MLKYAVTVYVTLMKLPKHVVIALIQYVAMEFVNQERIVIA
jgi:hypothetical protein